jgi:Zn-finger protein
LTEPESTSASKRCPRCGETKTAEHFPKDKRSKSGLFSYCYPCKNEYGRKRWHAGDEVRDRAYIATLEKRYGLTPERYQELLDEQNGRR